MSVHKALFDATVRHQVLLERLKANEVNQFASFLKQIDQHLRTQLAENELTEFSRTRVEKLLRAVDKQLAEIFANYYNEVSGSLIELAEYEAGFEAKSLTNAIANGAFEAVIPSVQQVKAAVLSAPLSVRGADGGKLLEPFISDWSHNERKRLTGAIRQGYFEGQTSAQIIQNLRGTRVNGYRDGLLAITSRNAEAIIRTAIQHVASTARSETLKENGIDKYRWVSTLDSRTSDICKSLDGEVFEEGKGPKPPAHIRCRSAHVAELDDDFAFLSEGRTRASKNGYVDSNKTYYEWLKDQPVDVQEMALGKTRAALFRNGGISAEKFARLNLGKNFKPITLAQFRKKEPLAFTKAFGE